MSGSMFSDFFSNYLVLLVMLGLVVVWLLLSALIGVLTGWFVLVSIYPDGSEAAVAKRSKAPAIMGGASLNGMLRIEVCPSGLRFAMNRVFAPFQANFFVPWGDIEIVQKHSFMPHPRTILLLGSARRKVTLAPEFVSSLMRDSIGVWPQHLMLPVETDQQLARRLFKQWLVATLIATVLLTVVPTLLMEVPSDAALLALGFAIPAVTIGVNYLFTYFKYRVHR